MSDSVIMFIGQIFNGLKIGSVYSLVALGYTMVYGIIRLINFSRTATSSWSAPTR